jgi:hypothetical protein
MSAIEEIRCLIAGLSPYRLAELRDYAEFLREKDRALVPIVLSDLFGTLSPERVAAMDEAIKDGCEQVDASAW